MKKSAATEVPVDPVAEEQAKRARDAKREADKAAARDRAKKSRARRKGKNTGAAHAGAQGADGAADGADGAPPSESPFGEVADAAASQQAAAGASPGAIVFNSPAQVAMYLCQVERMAVKAAPADKRPRMARVVAELKWRDPISGKPTEECEFACSLMWPWIEQGGLAWLESTSPALLAAAGALMLLAPALFTAMDEVKAHREEKRRASLSAATDRTEGGRVVEIRKEGSQ